MERPTSRHPITALGEVFNYLFDAYNSLESMTVLWTKVFVESLSAGGCLIVNMAVPGRCRGLKQAFAEATTGRAWWNSGTSSRTGSSPAAS